MHFSKKMFTQMTGLVLTLSLFGTPLLTTAASPAPDLVIEKLTAFEPGTSGHPQKAGHVVLEVQYKNIGTAAVGQSFDLLLRLPSSDLTKTIPQLDSYTMSTSQDGLTPIATGKFMNTKRNQREFTGTIKKLNPESTTIESEVEAKTLNKYNIAPNEISTALFYIPQDVVSKSTNGLKVEVQLNPKKTLPEVTINNNRKSITIANTKAADVVFGSVMVDLKSESQFPQIKDRILVAVPYKNVGKTKITKPFNITLRTTPKMGKKDTILQVESMGMLSKTDGTQTTTVKKIVTLKNKSANEFTAKITAATPSQSNNGTVAFETMFNKYNLAPGEIGYAIFYLPSGTVKTLGGLTLTGKVFLDKKNVEGNTTNNSFSVVVGDPTKPEVVPEPSDYLTYVNSELGFSFTYPSKFGTVDFSWIPGETGKRFVGTFRKVNMQFGGASADFTAGMGGSFLLFNDPTKLNTWVESEEYVKVLTSGSGVKTQLLYGKSNDSMDSLLEGERGAVLALKKSPNYPGLAFKVGANTGVSGPEFEQMLETIANQLD